MVSDQTKKIAFYRGMLRSIYRYESPSDNDTEADFQRFLEIEHEKVKAMLSEKIANREPIHSITATKHSLFLSATGLLTYGHLDVADDILDDIPNLPLDAQITQLARVLEVMLPLPDEMAPLGEPQAIRRWLKQHKSGLRWDQQQMKFVMDIS